MALGKRQWKTKVRKRLAQGEAQQYRKEKKQHPSMRYYPGPPRESELSAVRTGAGIIATKCKLGDRSVAAKFSDRRCGYCKRKPNRVALHVLQQCIKPAGKARVKTMKKLLTFTKYKQIKKVKQKYDQWVNMLLWKACGGEFPLGPIREVERVDAKGMVSRMYQT